MSTFAPAPGTDEEFDRIFASAEEAIASDPAAQAIDVRTRRETLAVALAKHGGKTYVPGPEPEDETIVWDEPETKPPVVPQGPGLLRIPELAPEPYWYEPPEDARFLDHLIMARRKLGARMQGGILITGPAGSGKTRGVVHAVERLNREHGLSVPLLIMHCPTITDEGKWFGRREATDGSTAFVKSDFITAVESGAIVLLDEFMRLHPRIHNPVMSLVDATEGVLLSDLNLFVRRHPQTVFIGTTNIGSQFGGTYRMDWAMRERWSYTIERDYPPRDEEIKILSTNNPGCDADAASVLVEVAQSARDMWLSGDLRAPVSTRTLDNAAFLVASGFTEREALERTVVPEYDTGSEGTTTDESDRAKIKQIIDGKFVETR